MIRLAPTFFAGALFAAGLGIAGITQPSKVLGFLDVAGRWDPSLGLVMVGAIPVYASLYGLIRRRARPLLSPTFAVPVRRDIDARLVGGSLLFGVGWGLAGYCPGPSVVSIASGDVPVLVFVGAMLAGMYLADVLLSRAVMLAAMRTNPAFRPEERTT